MSIRHALLGLALVTAGLTAGTAGVRADEGEHRRELHRVRTHDPVVIERTTTLRRLDRVLEGIEDVAALIPAPVVIVQGRGYAYGQRLRTDDATDLRARRDRDDDDDDDRDDDHARERAGHQPESLADLRYRGRQGTGRLAEERLDELRREVLALRRQVLRAPEVVTPRVAHPMDDHAFALFVRDVRRAAFARDKVEVVRDVAPHAHFTADQVATVVRVIQPWGQVDAAFALHPRVLDQQSFHIVINALTFSSDRDDLRRLIRR